MNKTLVGIVIVAVVVVGGYFLLRKPVQVAQTPTSSPSASPIATADTNTASIKLLSPNGGETFAAVAAGKTYGVVPVTWTTTNFSADEGINLIVLNNSGKEVYASSIISGGSQGSHNITHTLPAGQYKVKAQICTIVGPVSAECGKVLAEDISDGLFTITK